MRTCSARTSRASFWPNRKCKHPLIAAFGKRAEAYARGLQGLEALVCEPASAPAAYIEAVARRERGVPFYGLVLYDEPRTYAILNTVPQLLPQISELDAKPVIVNAFAAGTLSMGAGHSRDLWATVDQQIVGLVTEFALLCDAMLVRSQAEYGRLLPLCLKRRPRFETVLVEPALPPVERRRPDRPGVVVWAPDRPSQYIAYHALALIEFRGDVTCVTSDGAELADSTARFVRPDDPRVGEALTTASCVVCVEPEDPGAAVAFARRGYGIVAPLTSGAHEFVRDAVTFDYVQMRELHIAASIAISQPASVRYVPATPPAPIRPALPLPAEELPLVSIVTATYNRREDLRRMLSCLALQTYPRIEAVIVNDGGDEIDDIVERFPFARLINLPHGGATIAAMTGLAAAKGEYIQFNADDDWLEPDHIEALVGAMIRSGASVAHGNGLIRYQEREDDGSFSTVGFNATIFADTSTPTEALTATSISGNAMIVRRDVLDQIGTWRDDCILADQEFQIRAADRYAFAYVDRMTSEFRSRGKHQFSNTADSLPELRRIYEELHPAPGRPFVQKSREEALARVAGRPKNQTHVFPPTLQFTPVKATPVSDGPAAGTTNGVR